MSQSVNHKFKLKRGQQEAVERANPILEAGEPLAVFCKDGKTRLKIGDGLTTYKDLNFIGDDNDTEILTYPTELDFPVPPKPEQEFYLYKASNKSTLYKWNSDTIKYEALDDIEVNLTIDDIDVLNGGTASALLS